MSNQRGTYTLKENKAIIDQATQFEMWETRENEKDWEVIQNMQTRLYDLFGIIPVTQKLCQEILKYVTESEDIQCKQFTDGLIFRLKDGVEIKNYEMIDLCGDNLCVVRGH